jgi:uncharacterized protein (TIGR03435 family)
MDRRRRFAVAVVALCWGAIVAGQTATPQWEAVSIKPTSEPPTPGQGPRGANVVWRPYTTLQDLLVYAYEMPLYRIVGGPSWTITDRYTVLGKTIAPTTPSETRVLVQQLLMERFGLQLHREQREMAAYQLVFARSDRRLGPKIKPANFDCTPFLTGQRPTPVESPLIDVPGVGRSPRCMNIPAVNLTTMVTTPRLNGITIDRFVTFLQDQTNRPIRNATNLTGVFDIELTFVDESMPRVAGFDRTAPPEGLSLHTALGDQLGLKLEPIRASVEALVIDSVSMPQPD